MPLDARLRQRLDQALGMVDDQGTTGLRLLDDAARLWRRVRFFVSSLNVVSDDVDLDSLELASYALQLPLRRVRPIPTRRQLRTSLRDRCEHAAEMLVGEAGEHAGEELLDHTTRILMETPHRSPVLDESKVLADAVNLEDFGMVGLMQQMIAIARQGDGIAQLADGCHKREQYGYWEARLKDGFHFEPVRTLAGQRLENARRACRTLIDELKADEGE